MGRRFLTPRYQASSPRDFIALAALSHLEKMYQKSGFESVFYGTRFDLHKGGNFIYPMMLRG